MTVAPNMYCLMVSGVISALHTLARGASIAVEARATIPLFMKYSFRAAERAGTMSIPGRPIRRVNGRVFRAAHYPLGTLRARVARERGEHDRPGPSSRGHRARDGDSADDVVCKNGCRQPGRRRCDRLPARIAEAYV